MDWEFPGLKNYIINGDIDNIQELEEGAEN